MTPFLPFLFSNYCFHVLNFPINGEPAKPNSLSPVSNKAVPQVHAPSLSLPRTFWVAPQDLGVKNRVFQISLMAAAEVPPAIIGTTKASPATALVLVGEMSAGLATSGMCPGEFLKHF